MVKAVLLALLLLAPATPVRAQAADTTIVETRITGLLAALQITTEQLPAWNSFAEAMRAHAAATDALFRDRAANARLMNAADSMASYAAVTRGYADATGTLSAAFQTLYAALSDRQKGLADAMFRDGQVPRAPGQPPQPGAIGK